ncbi:MAG: hypothetical protein VB086_10725 [Clostridiaceae bacterium]|nr:hypothetical protein [Clostridiaceae bacterium]
MSVGSYHAGSAMLDFLNERISDCQARRKLLQKESRDDEADFEKIRENVYGIFKTVLSTGIGTQGETADGARGFFLEKLEQIPSNWTASYEKAAAHEDAQKMHIEGIKLEAVREIRDACRRIWEKEE